MKMTGNSRTQGLIWLTALSIGLGFGSPASARAFLLNSSGKVLSEIGGLDSQASGINDAGQVVGQSETAAGERHAFITGPNGVGMTDLGTLGGGYSSAFGINDAGQVVGFSYTTAGQGHAFITGPNGLGMTDLNSLVDLPGVILTGAAGINNAGEVIANSSVPNIPEPEIYALFLAGLGLIRFVAQRKKAKNLIKRY